MRRAHRSAASPAALEKLHKPARRRRDLYCYFYNDVKVRAPYDARHLLESLGLSPHPRQGARA